MTSLVAWVGADSHGPASLNIAADSRISWAVRRSAAYHWDQGKKVFASSTVPLVIGFVGDVLFPALVLPGIIDLVSTAECSRQMVRLSMASLRHSAASGGTILPLYVAR
jgi:hypothetical protein